MEPSDIKPGTLFLISTPIGNLKDITLRAIETLKSVDLIAAEDTRTSKILLAHYQIQTAAVSYHDHNKERVTPNLISRLLAQQSIALISDAGTPGISDPAFYVVREAVAHNIRVECIPGASAVIAAVVLSGLPTDRFVFEGFLPVQKGRRKRLEELSQDPRTLVFYESPYRLKRTLADLYQALGDRPIAIAREMTKKFEQIIRTRLAEIDQKGITWPIKGEFVLVVGGLTRKLKKE
ncbi:MAG TPA: 16S rRNA (cytidine(1402)-2'-O)-methyltransferase [bacterium]|nr:16S rRNA (cytidine(1402)-2'-O)-methyltransferase [bacterium]HNT66013.1 16S rRNA (cytidine(1402)-2'-O)-methyltransferase [bacterium]